MPDESPNRIITLIALFRSATRLMVGELVERLHAAGYADITAAQHLVFENLDAGGTRLTTLARRAGMTRQSITELVAVLEANGYLEVTPDPSDRRARLVRLTRQGEALTRRAVAEIAQIEASWQARFARSGLEADVREVLANALAGQPDPDGPVDLHARPSSPAR